VQSESTEVDRPLRVVVKPQPNALIAFTRVYGLAFTFTLKSQVNSWSVICEQDLLFIHAKLRLL
jgi:hypothetical protein